MTYSIALFTLGVLLLLICLPGQLRIKEYNWGTNNKILRLISGLFSIILIVLAGLIFIRSKMESSPVIQVEPPQAGQRRESEQLTKTVEGLGLVIKEPTENQIIRSDIYDGMQGRYSGELFTGYKLWVLARNQYHYFLMYPATLTDSSEKIWSQDNIRLATKGQWELQVFVATEEASAFLERKARSKDWSGLLTTPDGMIMAASVNVERK